jgi:hypothetical protein
MHTICVKTTLIARGLFRLPIPVCTSLKNFVLSRLSISIHPRMLPTQPIYGAIQLEARNYTVLVSGEGKTPGC